MNVDVIGRLNRLSARMKEDHHTINWGGCCVFAARVAHHLSQFVPTRIRVGQGWEGCDTIRIDAVRERVESNQPKEWNKAGLYFAHVIVEFEYKGKMYHYCADGVKKARSTTNMGGYRIVEGHLTNQEAKELAESKNGWNTCFDRDEIPDVHAIIDDAFDRMAKAGGVASKGKRK